MYKIKQATAVTFLFIVCWLPNACSGQSKLALDLFATPLIQDFRGNSDQESFLDHPNITAEYLFFPRKEFGAVFNQDFEHKFGWYAGVSYNTDSRSLRLTCYEDSLKRSYGVLLHYSKDIRIQRLAIKAGCRYSITDKIQLDLGVLTSYAIHSKISPEGNLDLYGYYYSPQTNLHVQVYEQRGINKMQIIPELKLSFEILKAFRIHVGARLKFWGPSYLYTHIEGSYETIDYSENILHLSAMRGSDLSFFTGLTYRIGIKNQL